MFDWDEKVRGGLLSAFFWGYMLSQIPGGVLSQRLGGSRLLAGALLTTSFITLLLPACALYGGWKAVFANRVLQGFLQVSGSRRPARRRGGADFGGWKQHRKDNWPALLLCRDPCTRPSTHCSACGCRHTRGTSWPRPSSEV